MRSTSLTPLRVIFLCGVLSLGGVLGSCAGANVPSARNTEIPTPISAQQRGRAINELPDSVMYLPLGDDILVPEVAEDDPLPYEMVGPFELRNETLAGALQLILADYDIGLAFETDAGMERRITVANLSGDLRKVVNRVCSLANLYCSFEDGTLVVKETQTFTVTLPPIGSSMQSSGSSSSSSAATGSTGASQDYLQSVSQGLAAILDTSPIVDQATRTIVYTATQRTSTMAERYLQRLRANTAMIVYETYIWEVQLSAGNSAGIDWSMLDSIGKYNISASLNGSVGGDFTNPISIGLPTTGNVSPTDFVNFLSKFGAVKTISQPQMTVLSGSSATMRVADRQNYVSEISSTLTDNQTSTSVTTDSVDSGFTLTIGSSWDKATVYTSVAVEITDVLQIDNFSVTGSGDDAETTRIQLPQTTERELNTQIRVRPGDSVLIGGLVRERDDFDKNGIGFMEPIIPQSRTVQSQNLELVIMMRPRVIVYTDPGDLRHMKKTTQDTQASLSMPIPVDAKVEVAKEAKQAKQAEEAAASYTSTRPDADSYRMTDPAPAQNSVEVVPLSPVAITPVEPVHVEPAPVAPVVDSRPAPVAPRLSETPSSSAYTPSTMGRRSSALQAVPTEPSVSVAPAYSNDAPPAAAPTRESGYVSPYETYDYYRSNY